jgi:MFS superfamily sulfate permease-like transporter
MDRRPRKPVTTDTPRFRFDLREIGDACGDLGTLLPLALGAMAMRLAATELALPQLALTLTNAILLTALVAGDCFGSAARHVTPRRLTLSTAIANLALPPFGALPVCHGAGGLAAHHRFGARTGGAPLMLGLALIALAALPGGRGLAAMAAVPSAALGTLLLVAAAELAFSRRLTDSRPSCWPVIALTAVVTLAADPFFGLVAGGAAELVRRHLMRAVGSRSR